jgi:hypothetical protein
MAPGLYRLIDLVEKHGNVGGTLIMFQPGTTPDGLPFTIEKVLYMTDIRAGDVRGGHAHFATEELLVCLRGACTVELDDGCGRRESVRIDRRDRALLLYPHVWRVLRDFAPDTELLAVAGRAYDERDYIRDRARFEELAPGWQGRLGGSAERA